MKRVCHLTSVHPPFDIRIFHKQCVSLANAGYKVKLIAPNGKRESRNGVEVIPIKLPTSRLTRMLVVSFRMYWLAIQTKSGIYHFHDPELMLCGVLLRISGKKVIFDIHENVRLSITSKDWIPKILRGIVAFIYYVFERIALLFFNKLVLAEDSYLKYYPKSKSIVVLNYPLSVETESNEKTFYNEIKFVYSGVVHPLRGLWEMLEIIKRLIHMNYKVSLVLVGEIRPPELSGELEKYLKDNNLTDCVKFHGKVDYSKVSHFLTSAHIGFSILKPIPNYIESLPTKIFEYMQHGLPVVTNNFPLYKQYVEESVCGICIDINNIEDTVAKIKELLNNEEKLMEMSKNSKKIIINAYNWKSQEAKLFEIYSVF